MINTFRSAKIVPSFVVFVFCLITVLTSAVSVQAQQTSDQAYQTDIANAKKVWSTSIASSKAALYKKRAGLLYAAKANYEVQIRAARAAKSVDQAKAAKAQYEAEVDGINADYTADLNESIANINDAFYRQVVQICNQYGKPLPRWAAPYKRP